MFDLAKDPTQLGDKYRALWDRDHGVHDGPIKPIKLQLNYHQCLGDYTVATAGIASLMDAYPGRYILRCNGEHCKTIFANNPYVRDFEGKPDKEIKMDNILINEARTWKPFHFMESYCKLFERELGVKVPLRVSRPQLYLTDQEKQNAPLSSGGYWVLHNCGKNDYTVKHFPHELLQQVVNRMMHITFVVVGEAHHKHKPLDSTINYIGQTPKPRDLIRLIYHADGVLTGESFPWHVAAAFNKPAVCLAAGWLARSWVSYNGATILSKQGCLPCCATSDCGAKRVVPLPGADHKNNNPCQFPDKSFSEPVAKCMSMITPAEIEAAIEAYYTGGRLKLERLLPSALSYE